MIRQAISCDICGTEMQNPNHWFAASDHGSELRVSRWDGRSRLRSGSKHLCGQTCLHKLLDEFTARALDHRESFPGEKSKAGKLTAPPALQRTDTSPASPKAFPVPPRPIIAAAYIDDKEGLESSARLLPPLEAPRGGRAEAWKSERERQQQSADQDSVRRRSIA
jgi:hypothetical protein